jgi:hypothetical protein
MRWSGPRAGAALLSALAAALPVADRRACGDSFLDRTAPVQDAVPYGLTLDPATPAVAPPPTPAATP